MSAPVDTAQSEAWNGEEGRHWSDHQDRWNAVNEGFNHPLLTAAAIDADTRVLDIGCGAGQTTRLAARTAAATLGLDLSGPMLATARALAAAEGLERIAFEQGDAQVHPLPAAAFDVAISRFGIMFFADPVAAFANIARALRPGGRLAFVCMADPARTEWIAVHDTVRGLLAVPAEEPGPADGPGMFSLADPDLVRRTLDAAGFDRVRTEPVDAAGRFGRDAQDAADLLLGSGPGRHLLTLLDPGHPDAAAPRVRAAFTTALTPHQGPDGVRLRTAAHLVTAVRR
ncbi:class I SAM-dependent methyltransferase [Kitasatospora cineracea]|uniref:Ubiquinone/menaquinone biosynthesis C-methylase UbiE n=1 Tax=Kitasatospora cineracea TaxID=88074 RepID=A0A3N4SD95_9ACTN|nr:class I SAM-dependent methyltransferase [Kitasatospora cineracea]RPE36630.1 ubiquinone/menaquinone biosynthesis C-methylase UbiE [Kitasatospora cineracea]